MSVETCNTALVALARERGWRICSYDENGEGIVQISANSFLEIEHDNGFGDGEEGWTVAVKFHSKTLPAGPLVFSTGLGMALNKAALAILDVSDDELAEARKERAAADEG
jgi:hypothetical protein